MITLKLMVWRRRWLEIKEMMATVHERWMFLGVSDYARPLLAGYDVKIWRITIVLHDVQNDPCFDC